jgi:DNA-binding transcriptional LysR family regulator
VSELDWFLQINVKARHLRLLVTIDAYRNLTEVAEVTQVTLSAVSRSLSELEGDLGVKLFRRTAQCLVPTTAGDCLIRHAKGFLTVLHKARDELNTLSARTERKVHIGILPAASSALLPKALSLLKARSPGINVTINEGTRESVLFDLWQGRFDLVVGCLPAPDTQGSFIEKELLEEPVRLVTGRHHPLAGQTTLAWSDLRAYPWILPPPGSILRDPLERALEAHDLSTATNYIETLSVQVASAYLQMSNFIGVMTGSSADGAADSLHVLPLNLPRLLRPVGVLWNRNRSLAPSAQLMVECLDDAARQLRSRPCEKVLPAIAD